MAPDQKFALMVMLLALVPPALVASTENEFMHCQRTVRKWSASLPDAEVVDNKHTLEELLFFLHVPRTGGRTYFHCFLKKLYSSYLECPRSYDKLHFDPSKPDCRLMVTHDDYSVVSKLPKEKTSVVTILRNPVDRVFSTYEFSVEVAARFLMHPNLSSAIQMTGRIRSINNGVSTLDIWPWKYLVPWMREDVFSRRDAREHGDFDDINKSNNSYNMKQMVIPLHEFINDPIAHDIIHNGATFQVAGLTNNSYLAESHEVRHCVRKYKPLGKYVLDVAKRRLDKMLYVGLTEEHKESATMFANVVGLQVISQLQNLSSMMEQAAYNKTEMSSSPHFESDSNHLLNRTHNKKIAISSAEVPKTTDENMVVGELMEAYEACISTLRKSQGSRRTFSLKKISPVNFSKEARLQVPEEVRQQILLLNTLDVELYKHAKTIFLQQQKNLMQKLEEPGRQKGGFNNTFEPYPWKGILVGITMLLLIFISLLIKTRRRNSKLKV